MKNFKSIYRIFFYILIAQMLINSQFAKATQALDWYSEEYPPYNFIDKKDNRPAGISVDYLIEIFRDLNLDQTRKDIKIMPWSRGYNMAQQKGLKTVIFACTRTQERENLFKWVGPLAPTKISLFGKKGEKALGKLPKGDASVRYAVIRDDIGQALLLKNGIKPDNLIVTSNIEQMLDLVKIGRVKYIAYEESVLKYKIKQLKSNAPKLDAVHTLKSGELWYAFNKSIDDSVVRDYQKAFDNVLAKKKLVQKIKSKYQD